MCQLQLHNFVSAHPKASPSVSSEMRALASDGASPREVLGRAVKISGIIEVLLGVVAMLASVHELAQLLYRFMMGAYLVCLGVLAYRLGSSATGTSAVSPVMAQFHFFMAVGASVIVSVVDLAVLVMNEALADLICGTTAEDCGFVRATLIAFSVVYLIAGVCVLGPLAYIARRFFDEMQETSQWGRQVQLPSVGNDKMLATSRSSGGV